MLDFIAQLSLKNVPNTSADKAHLQTISGIVFTIIGGIALLVITIAGFRYIVSQGNPQQTAQAKNMIIYAAIGLIVSVISGAIVTFVIGYL